MNLNEKRHLRSDSMSSGYSSGSGGIHQPAIPFSYHSQTGYPNEQDSVMSGFSAGPEHHYTGFNYDQQEFMPGYVDEDPYGYGTYAYPPSSIYEEEMHQQDGWFYLPSASHQMPYPPNGHDFSMQSQGHQYLGNERFTQYPCYPSQGKTESHIDMSGALWNNKYGALNETFMDPSIYSSPLAQAINSTCAETTNCEPNGLKGDVKKYPSFRYRNGEKTVLIPPSAESRRRKTVRFSKTVNQRVEHCDSEVEDSTSVIKGCSGEENYDIPSAWKAQDPQKQQLVPAVENKAVNACGPVSEPIYEFPTGHIENSCMCSDCQLARSSCQLQVPALYPYY